MHEISVAPRPLDRLAEFLDPQRNRRFTEAMERASSNLSGRTVWHINSAGEGGGVAEMLRALLPYLAASGVAVRWLVLDADEDFFEVTKRLHHMLHGADPDNRGLGDEDRSIYEQTVRKNAGDWNGEASPRDIVVLHDPQVAGLAPHLRERGCSVLWSCHIGADEPNDIVRAAWRFLLPYVRDTDAQTFSRRAYVWDGLDEERVAIIPPCIDPVVAKNQPLDASTVEAVLETAGLIETGSSAEARFQRQDGSDGIVSRKAVLTEDAALPPSGRIVVQVSRWDPLKDPIGVLRGFARHVTTDAHLVLAGPATEHVEDDPESAAVFADVLDVWRKLPRDVRSRVHLARLPMDDPEENAATVNALQRRADVVVQKSLAEGFGLTVAEAMWKSRPTIGSRVGGIQDQIVDGESGLLVDDPSDLASFGSAVTTLLDDPERATRLGEAAHERAVDQYLPPRYLTHTMDLIEKVIG